MSKLIPYKVNQSPGLSYNRLGQFVLMLGKYLIVGMNLTVKNVL